MKIKTIVIVMVLLVNVAQAQNKITFDKSRWTELKFSGYPPNKVEYSAEAIKVSVDSSASPLVYKLEKTLEVTGFSVSLVIKGEIPESKEFDEDSYFRLGLVALGETRLGTFSRLIAPKWALELFKLAPEGAGLDKIYFYNIAATKSQLGQERINPRSEFMYEKAIAVKNSEIVDIKYTLTAPLKTLALWISIDGDTTKSKFTTEIKSITLNSL